jgi:hypothetical protein
LTAVFSNGTGFIDHGVGSVASGVGVSTGPVTAATTFTLTVTNEFGDSVTAQVTLGNPGCIGQVVSNGYSCGNAPSCADCKDNNGNSREAGCKKAIDCIAEKGTVCDTNCENNCRNLAGDSVGQACVTALKTAACGGSGC